MAVTSTCQSYNACARIIFEEFLISTRVVAFLKSESISSRLQILSYFLHYILAPLSGPAFKNSPHMEDYSLGIKSFFLFFFGIILSSGFFCTVFRWNI